MLKLNREVQDTDETQLIKDSELDFGDQVITAFMVIVRIGIFMPKIVLKIYCTLKEENVEFAKAKSRLVTANGLSEESLVSELLTPGRSQSNSSLQKFTLKCLIRDHPIIILFVLLVQLVYLALIYQMLQSMPNTQLNNLLGIELS